ncbi:MAG: hypothetical protein AAF085_03110, partial [Planctomycetota bacterium]
GTLIKSFFDNTCVDLPAVECDDSDREVPPIDSETIILPQATDVDINVNFYFEGSVNTDEFRVDLLSSSGAAVASFVPQGNSVSSESRTLFLNPGTYTLRSKAQGNCQVALAKLTWYEERQVQKDVPLGGLRIQKIENFDTPLTEAFRARSYDYGSHITKGTGLSSGYRTGREPDYTYAFECCYDCAYDKQSSSSSKPLGSGFGPSVAYREVREIYGEEGEFGAKTSVFSDYFDKGVLQPYAPPNYKTTSQAWKRGQLEEEYTYKKGSNGDFIKVRQVKNEYVHVGREEDTGLVNDPHFTKVYHTVPAMNVYKYNEREGLSNPIS